MKLFGNLSLILIDADKKDINFSGWRNHYLSELIGPPTRHWRNSELYLTQYGHSLS